MWENQRPANFATSLTSVAAVYSPSYSYELIRGAVESVLGLLDFGHRIKPGDKVMIKPYLTDCGQQNHDIFGRRTSHPLVITVLVELLKDCGAVVYLGDEGSKRYRDIRIPEGREWLHELAKRTGMILVSFAKAGAVSVRSNVWYPREYLITRALLDADIVVNCANGQPHRRLLLSGAVRNMFNALIGHTQEHIYELCKDNRHLAHIVADVCGVVRPAFSLLDLTTVRELEASNTTCPINLILASENPASIDTVAAHVLGWQGRTIWTTQFAAQRGLGSADMEQIQVLGIGRSELHRITLDAPNPVEKTNHDRFNETISLFTKKTLFKPLPVIVKHRCNGCGDCSTICPVAAIGIDEFDRARIRYKTCKDCRLCIETCTSNAIELHHVGVAKMFRQIKCGCSALWNQCKIGVQLPLGPISASFRLARRVKVSSNRRGHSAISVTLPMGTKCGGKDIWKGNNKPENDISRIRSCRGQIALIVGTGPGLGSALAANFADAGMDLAVAARNTEKLLGLVQSVKARGSRIGSYGCDVQRERSVKQLFNMVEQELGPPDLVIYNVEHFVPGGILDIEPPAFEDCWRAMTFGAFLIGKEAAKRMVDRGKGTIIFTGATASLRGSSGYINLAVGKFGIRALAQSMARELGPKGVHVAHVIIDGGILSQKSNKTARERMSNLFPNEISNTYLHLFLQHPSAWTQEIDLRPWVEKF